MTEQEYNKKLVEKYPFIAPRNIYTGEVVKNYDYSYTILDHMPKGWKWAFGELLCEKIKEELVKNNLLDQYRVNQVKEKFGSLCWYDENSTDEIANIIYDFEYISSFTCVECGKLGVPMIDAGYIIPCCLDCYLKRYENFGYTSKKYEEQKMPMRHPFKPTYEIERLKGDNKEVIHRDVSNIISRIESEENIKEDIIMSELLRDFDFDLSVEAKRELLACLGDDEYVFVNDKGDIIDKELFNQAVEHFNVSNEDKFLRNHSNELTYCYLNKKDILDFDFWTQYETLLGEEISWDEYVAIDNQFDGSPMDVEVKDKDIVSKFKSILKDFRSSKTVDNIIKEAQTKSENENINNEIMSMEDVDYGK